MLGNVVTQDRPSEVSKISTRLRDAILENWAETRDGSRPTLCPQGKISDEFWLNASETKQWCPRLYAYASLFDSAQQIRSAEDLWNMGQGTAYHNLFQNSILPVTFKTCFEGDWTSNEPYIQAETAQRLGFELSKNDGEKRIIECGYGAFDFQRGARYLEPKIRMPDYRMVVKVDGIIRWPDGAEVLELKTEKSSARDQLEVGLGGGPRAHHVEQVHIGMFATGIHRARIVYIFKGESSLSNSLLEHEIPYDEAIISRLIAKAKDCVAAVKACDDLRGGKSWEEMAANPALQDTESRIKWIDERFKRDNDCPMKSKGKARYCAARDLCFWKKPKTA
ncbi:MAG: hypothetical protein PHI12_09845 [Dehalococcoidales bacterium]|nr:hypothetical protein [Dehalococcoidales bacterium]